MGRKYAVGIDFGTLSARAVLIDLSSGCEVATSVYGYQDTVIDRFLPETNIELPINYALQNPADYSDAAESLLGNIWKAAGIAPESIISIGIAFTACTVLPVDENMVPLCYNEAYRNDPQSWAKLWKHHGAQDEADRINRIACERGEGFIRRYGGQSSSEWLFAKLIEVYDRSSRVYHAMHKYMEAGDWLVGTLTGRYVTSTCMAGFKAFWDTEEGYPSRDFFKAIDPGLEFAAEEKVLTEVLTVGSRAGGLTKEMAQLTGLSEGTGVGVSMIDAHAAFPAVGITEEQSMLMVMGTSLCHILISSDLKLLEGIGGVVKDGVIPGYYGYEAGQAAVGDIFEWFIVHLFNHENAGEAEERNISAFDVIDAKAGQLRPGEAGLIALDWWNGNRSMLNNSDLSGLILGFSLATKPEEVYRCLIESTAFGTRKILESIEESGIEIKHLYACGGLSRKSELVMQIFSDVLGREINVSNIAQTTAYGAAMFGTLAAGKKSGGFDDIFEAVSVLTKPTKKKFKPNLANHAVYCELYKKYKTLHDYFGVRNPELMVELRSLREGIAGMTQRV